MHRKREVFILSLVIGMVLGIGMIAYMMPISKRSQENEIEEQSVITIQLEGEVVRPVEVYYSKPVSYGILFLRMEYIFNEYSDLTEFDLDEMISNDKTIIIPSKDIKNNYVPDARVCINEASLIELTKLPQIGEKRGQKILDYIQKNGRITSWEIFFKIVGVPENAKISIQQQAFL